jgi:hypothetical protein
VPLAGAAAQVALLGFFTLTVALYAVPVLAIVLVVPADRLTGLTGFIDALAAVFVVYGPWEGLVGAVAALATGWSALALAAALWPGLGTANPDAHLPDGFVGQRLVFTVAELVPLGLVPLAAFLLARTRRSPAR